jgi:hypothetical protein
MRKSSPIQVKEISGDHYPNLVTAQDKAVKGIASDFAEIIKRLQADGLLINDNGRIIPNPERMQSNERLYL